MSAIGSVSLIIIFYTFVFFSLGRIVQKVSSVSTESYIISIPIGFVIYWSLTQILYMPFVAFDVGIEVLSIIEVVKNSFIFILIVANYDSIINFKKIKNLNTWKSFSIFLVSFLSLFFLVQFSFLGTNFQVNTSGIEGQLNNQIIGNSISDSIGINIVNDNGAELAYSANSFYFFESVTLNVTNADLYIFNAWFINYFFILITLLTSIYVSSFYFKGSQITFTSIIMTFVFIMISFFSSDSVFSIFGLTLFLLSWGLFLNNQRFDDNKNNSLMLSTVSLFSISAFQNIAVLYILIWLVFILIILSMKKQSFTRVIIFTVSILLFSTFNWIFFIANSQNFVWIIYLIVTLAFILLSAIYYQRFIFIWLKIETFFFDNYKIFMYLFSVLSAFIGIIILSINTDFYINDVLIPVFFNSFSNHIDVLDYFLAVVKDLTVVLLFILGLYYFNDGFKDSANRSIAYASFIIILVFYNPLSISFYSILFSNQISSLNNIFYVFLTLIILIAASKLQFNNKNIGLNISKYFSVVFVAIQISLTISFSVLINFNTSTLAPLGYEEVNYYINTYIPNNSYVIGDLYMYDNNGKNIHYDEYLEYTNTSGISKNPSSIYWNLSWVSEMTEDYLDNVVTTNDLYIIKSKEIVNSNAIPDYFNECSSHETNLSVFYVNSSMTKVSCSI